MLSLWILNEEIWVSLDFSDLVSNLGKFLEKNKSSYWSTGGFSIDYNLT